MGIISFKNERIYYKGDLFTVILGPYSKHKFLCKVSSYSPWYIPERYNSIISPGPRAYDTKEDAESAAGDKSYYISTIKIEWEE